jgi:hypothetical protein
MIIGICGFIGSGKDTVADYLVNFHEFRRESFASTLKDACSAVFGWDRVMLEGRTKEAREWREQVDPWWAQRLNMPHLTPRWVLQYWGTEVCRKGFQDDIWIASLENKIRNSKDNVVISDCRFPNEIKAIKNAGGIVVWVQRGELPSWYNNALWANVGSETDKKKLEELGVHSSETAWVGTDFDVTIGNNGTIDALYKQAAELVKSPELDPLDANERPLYVGLADSSHILS